VKKKMSKEKDEKLKTTRRTFLKGLGAGAVVAAAAVAGVEEYRMAQAPVTPVTPKPPGVGPGLSTEVTLNVNGIDHTLLVDNRWNLADVLREQLGLTGTKVSCDRGECGACTVLVDGVPMLSCVTLAADMGGKKITTIEGIGTSSNLDKLQASFRDNLGSQCGICSPGMIIVSKALLDKNPKPTEDEIRQALSGNLCRCGNYPNILKSVQGAM
jgi:aerobic-type carbon monoxide dehydrogenase small subunit (CoxS/CutS family)